ncbi:DegT/DnrJ/EryC1/StrS family aminotransferase [Sinosporangium siamense]|uniref:Aminotransferase DegT n=1 Tax=Sinosporangium siamense TaxID=1367973 RepID=A0A919V789_9ACTN|nr:DegT/DnrJ/EryC1/StrS family aminotransferase [Sinosporangium siamense]GII92836.1 aminotransferase DegT [Sinosporangium siamense]
MGMEKPAVLGGAPAFATALPFTRPTTSADARVTSAIAGILASGTLTKGSELRRLEEAISRFLGVEHAVVTSSGTTGLMLTMRCLGLSGDVILPSFTFMASGHAARWNGLDPVFADIDPQTFVLSPESAAEVSTSRTSLVMGVHTFGVPCDVEELEQTAARHAVPLILDSAHGFGGVYPDGSMIGSKSTAEVFSLSPTKPFTCGEGGLITTGDADLARELKIAREYGNPGDFDSLFIGLNGRLPEMSAALGLHNLPGVPGYIEQRRQVAEHYRANLHDVAGITFQHIPEGARSTYKDFVILIDPDLFGVDRDTVAAALRGENIDTRRYFDPPLHLQTAYRRWADTSGPLPVTETVAARVLALPMFSQMTPDQVDGVCDAMRRIGAYAADLSVHATVGRA